MTTSDSMIQEHEAFLRDWHWYAVDEDGHIAHFANGGLRLLPFTVRRNREAVERLERYFFDEAPVVGASSIRPGAEKDAGWVNDKERNRHLKFPAQMASKGLFSYDTEIDRSGAAKYYLLVLPQSRLTIDALAESVRNEVMQTRAPFCFERTPHIPEAVTLDW